MPEQDPGGEVPVIKTKAEFEAEVAAERALVLAADGYVTDDGDEDLVKIEDKVLARVLAARVEDRASRASTVVTRGAMVRHVFPNLYGPGTFRGQAVPDVAAKVCAELDYLCWTLCRTDPSGPIQKRLNGEHSVVLCRTDATAEKGVKGVCVARDRACLVEDLAKPDNEAIKKAIRKASRDVVMVAERVPEHAPALRQAFRKTVNGALASGTADINGTIEAGSPEPESEGDAE